MTQSTQHDQRRRAARDRQTENGSAHMKLFLIALALASAPAFALDVIEIADVISRR